MISIHTLELTLETNSKEFNKLLSRAYELAREYRHRLGKSTKHTSNDVRVDAFLASSGITIEYHKCEFRKIIRLRINPSEILGGNDLKLWKPSNSNINKLIAKLEIHIDRYFDSEYELNDFTLTRVEFTANINVGKANVPAYINLMHKIGKVKKFSPKYSKTDYSIGKIDKEHSFDLEGNSNDIDFTIYDKEADLRKKNKDNKSKKAKGVLRIEVRLKKRKAVRQAIYNSIDKSNMDTDEEIKIIAGISSDTFMDTFVDIVPFGDFYRLNDAEELVHSSNFKKNQKEKMLHLLRLIPEKKSLYLALKELNVRRFDDIMGMFAELNVSPVTISKRESIGYLENLYNYVLSKD